MIRSDVNNIPKRADTTLASALCFALCCFFGLIVAASGQTATVSTIRPNRKPESGAGAPQLPSDFVRLPGHVLPALARATKIAESARQSRKEASQPITLTLVLKRDDQAGFARFLHDVYDRRSPDFPSFS